MRFLSFLVLLLGLVPVAFGEVYRQATIWGDVGRTHTVSWSRSMCGAVQCVEEHYVVRVTHKESGLLAFPDIVTDVGQTSATFVTEHAGHYLIWVKAVNPIGESPWAKFEEGTNNAPEYQEHGAWIYSKLPDVGGGFE